MSRSPIAATLLAAFMGAVAAAWCFAQGYTLYYGDADAHLNIARRIFDSRTPGPSQIGTVWLPLPHLVVAPLAQIDALWQTGLAGVLPSVAAYAVAAGFLFGAASRAFSSTPAAWAAVLLFVLNPNMLYLQSTPMTEAVFAASLAVLLYATLRFRESQSVAAVLFAAAASNAASLTRYEGWFQIPFTALYFWFAARNKRHATLFAGLAALAPLAWLAHNVYYYEDAFAFYRGPYSALAIYQRQLAGGMPPHPGTDDWIAAAHYYLAAARLVLGMPLLVLGGIGAIVAIARRSWWPVAFLALPAIFYIWSIHSGGTPVFVPELPPYSRYNTRYALAMLPAAAFAASACVVLVPRKLRVASAVFLPVATGALWLMAEPLSACWQESANGSRARIARNTQAAGYLTSEYQPGQGIVFNFGDLAGVLRQAAIPLRETLYQDNIDAWRAAVAQPASLAETWALTIEGDPVWLLLREAPSFQLRHRIIVEGAPAIELYSQ